MRIAFDVRRIRDYGVGTYIRNLLEGFARIGTDDEFHLIGGADDLAQLPALPANFRRVAYERQDSARLDHFTCARLIHGLHADLTHIPFHRVPLLLREPYVATVHDLSSIFYDKAPEWLHRLRLFRLRRGLGRAARIITVSGATKRDVASLLPEAADRIRLIYNAPDPRFFAPADSDSERARILERYQIRYPFLLYAGSIRPQKNIPRLVEAFAVARAQLENHPEYRDLRLIIIGDEISRHPDVRRAVIHSRVEHSVRFLGFLPFETLRIFHEIATAFIFPSLYEGFGLPPLEAMASGTPVVASRAGALPEVVGGAAMLVNPEVVFDIARGITEVLLNKELREDLIAHGKTQARRFSWDRTAREVTDSYREAVR